MQRSGSEDEIQQQLPPTKVLKKAGWFAVFSVLISLLQNLRNET